jgi:hypothetical protein
MITKGAFGDDRSPEIGPSRRDKQLAAVLSLTQIVIPHIRLPFVRNEQIGEPPRDASVRERGLGYELRETRGSEDGFARGRDRSEMPEDGAQGVREGWHGRVAMSAATILDGMLMGRH